jgi:hypothetical protein
MPAYKTKTTKDNKRKKVVKGKSVTGSSKFKSVTNKKTGLTTKTTKSGKGKNKTKSTKFSASIVLPMLRQLAPDSPTAKKMKAAIRQEPIATKAKPIKIKAKPIKAKRLPKQKLVPMAKMPKKKK